jgi:hypothetical protein
MITVKSSRNKLEGTTMPRHHHHHRHGESSRRHGDSGSGGGGRKGEGDSNFFKHMGKEVKKRLGETKIRELESREINLRNQLAALHITAQRYFDAEVSEIRRWVRDKCNAEVEEIYTRASNKRIDLAEEWVKATVHSDVYTAYTVAVRDCHSEEEVVHLANRYMDTEYTGDVAAFNGYTSSLAAVTTWAEEQVERCWADREAIAQQQERAAHQKLTGDQYASLHHFNSYLDQRGSAITPFNINDTEALLNNYENSTHQRYEGWPLMQEAHARQRAEHDNPPLPAYSY